MTLDERIHFLEAYIKEFGQSPFGYGHRAEDYLDTCEKLKALGLEWGDPIDYRDFRITKGKSFTLTNSVTHYKFDKDTYYIRSKASVSGRRRLYGWIA